MNRIFAIAKYTFRENLRNKIYLVLVIFGITLIFVSLLLSVLGGEQSTRILLDFGLSGIEFFALLMMVFSGVNLILEEVESKSIYLILVRPMPRWYYLLGRYLGLLFAIYASMLAMAIAHALLLLLNGWPPDTNYILSILFSCMKIAIVGSLALFFSLFSTSNISTLVFTFLLWIAGHFTQEIYFLTKKIAFIPARIILRAVYYLIPNLQYFNWHELYGTAFTLNPGIFFYFLYGIGYSCAALCLAFLLFRKKEF